jgi:Uri superfamily endonuclease
LNAVYVLIIRLEKTKAIKIGSVGEQVFQKGMYAYTGSAQSNFHKRIERHLRRKKKLFWHIDYLLNNENTIVLKIFFKLGIKKGECNLAGLISKKGKAIPRFGSSDCKCKSHLIRIEDFEFLEKRLKELNKNIMLFKRRT